MPPTPITMPHNTHKHAKCHPPHPSHPKPDNKVHEAYMGPTWGQQDPGEPHVGPMNLSIREHMPSATLLIKTPATTPGVGVGWRVHCICCGYYGVPLKWVTFGDPRVPTYGYTFGDMSLELGLVFYHHRYNWGPTSVFPVILVTKDTELG